MIKTISIGLIIGATLLSAGCVSRQVVYVGNTTPVHSVNTTVNFSDLDRSRIKGYYLNNRSKMDHHRHKHKSSDRRNKHHQPNRYAKKKKRYKRHQKLPKRVVYSRLTPRLDRQLHRLPKDYIRVRIGNDVFIMNVRTRIIYDAIYGLD